MSILGTTLAASWRRLGLLPLALGAATLLSGGSIIPYGVNDRELIVGEYVGGAPPMAFLYNPATTTYSYFIPTFPGVTSSAFVGINDSGQISGSYTTTSGNFGLLLSAGTFTTISAPGAIQTKEGSGSHYLFSGGGIQVSGINDNGVIVGGSLQPSIGEVGRKTPAFTTGAMIISAVGEIVSQRCGNLSGRFPLPQEKRNGIRDYS